MIRFWSMAIRPRNRSLAKLWISRSWLKSITTVSVRGSSGPVTSDSTDGEIALLVDFKKGITLLFKTLAAELLQWR